MFPKISSTKTQKKFLWVKIPRTGTYSYARLFGLYNPEFLKHPKHVHAAYWHLKNFEKLPAFTVVRNPVDRFYSILGHYLFLQENCKQGNCIHEESQSFCAFHSMELPQENEKDIFDFFTSLAKKDFRGLEHTRVFNDALFKSQTFYAYNPNVKIFRYENIQEFNEWIVNELGYDVSKLEFLNKHNTRFLSNIDKQHPYFIKTAEYLYNIDFKVFNYPLQYLT